MISRRNILLTALALPGIKIDISYARTASNNKLIVVILRGAMDGMSVIQPYGDKNITGLRGSLLLPASSLNDLGGFYGMHPSMKTSYELYKKGQFLPYVAIAGNYRYRSHFIAQDCLESGSDHYLDSGWLNRLTGLLGRKGVAVDSYIPHIIKGKYAVEDVILNDPHSPSSNLYQTIEQLYGHSPQLQSALATGLQEKNYDNTVLNKMRADSFKSVCGITNKLINDEDGPNIAVIEIGGWDTHTNQTNRLQNVLSQFDAGIDILSQSPSWNKTIVFCATEFGRTVAVNGTGGTDHGTASMAFLAGGNINGGRVYGTWPGLAPNQLFENRDLAPTTDLRAVAKSILIQHLHLSNQDCETVFPGSLNLSYAGGLIKA